MKKPLFKTPSTRIIFRYCSVAILIFILVSLILPNILNYPPESINTPFDIKMSYISYTQQFVIITIVTLSFISLITKLLLRDIDNWYKNDSPDKYNDVKTIKKIRKKCFNLPYIIFLAEIILPIIGAILILAITGSHHSAMLSKLFILLISSTMLLSVLSYIFSKGIYAQILSKTYKPNIDIGFRVNLGTKVYMQIFPICIIGLLVTSLIGYSRSVKDNEDLYFDIYSRSLHSTFDTSNTYTEEELKAGLDSIELYNTSHTKFMITSTGVTITLNGPEPSNYVIAYTQEISERYNGKTADSYGVDTQGATLKISTPDGPYYVGILYNVYSEETLYTFLYTFLFLVIVLNVILFLVTRSLSKDLATVSTELSHIYQRNNSNFSTRLPIVSNDEIGDLVNAFNKIQELTKQNIDEIHSNQETLMEKERLASLGQLIGGIAHNLKTPIMSISGANEGISELIDEYESSIGDPEVTIQDHHDIAHDMRDWLDKIKNYTEYMSDVITAVKGQAVALSENPDNTFTIEELIKRINILMKHELNNALVTLNISMLVDENLEIHGNINSLVQVMNNIISNSIQAYNGQKDVCIDAIFEEKDHNLVIAIRDYACGMPEAIRDKLFKEMITTKGKNGTGLGLFMSYSNIKAHFNGNMSVESEEGKGSTFYITIPLY